MSYTIQKNPFVVPTTDGKIINEHFGLATDGNSETSIAHMIAPAGWSEPFKRRNLMSSPLLSEVKSSL